MGGVHQLCIAIRGEGVERNFTDCDKGGFKTLLRNKFKIIFPCVAIYRKVKNFGNQSIKNEKFEKITEISQEIAKGYVTKRLCRQTQKFDCLKLFFSYFVILKRGERVHPLLRSNLGGSNLCYNCYNGGRR